MIDESRDAEEWSNAHLAQHYLAATLRDLARPRLRTCRDHLLRPDRDDPVRPGIISNRELLAVALRSRAGQEPERWRSIGDRQHHLDHLRRLVASHCPH